jgi:hypothetical protein
MSYLLTIIKLILTTNHIHLYHSISQVKLRSLLLMEQKLQVLTHCLPLDLLLHHTCLWILVLSDASCIVSHKVHKVLELKVSSSHFFNF